MLTCDFQVRSKVQSSKAFGRAEEVTCGGNALPFYAAVRLRMIRKELIKANDKVMIPSYNLLTF